MYVQDYLEASKIVLLEKNHPWLAGFCELGYDWGALISVGIGGASVYHLGFCQQSIEIIVALGAAAVLGTRGGWGFSRRFKTEPT